MRDGSNLAEKDFIDEGAVEVSGVKEGDAAVDGVVDDGDHVLLRLGRAIEGRHAQAS